MKKLFLPITLSLFLISCDAMQDTSGIEQDTRLICDCDYVYSDFERSECDSSVYNMNNKSLVFNESKSKFAFSGFNFPDDYLEFSTDKIIFNFKGENLMQYNVLDRISLVYSDSDQRLNGFVTDNDGNETPFWKPSVTTFYNCRVTDGV